MLLSPIARGILFVTAGVLLAGLTTAGFATRADAQNYPWCLQSSAYEGGENCGFATHEQCMATLQGIGGFCQINTEYQASVTPSPRRALKARPGKQS
jgi:hypothetical protein